MAGRVIFRVFHRRIDLDKKIEDLARSILGVAIAILLLALLYAYVFLWHNTPNLARLLGLNA